MKPFIASIFLLLAFFSGWTQSAWFPEDSTLVITISNGKRERVDGAKVFINGLPMEPCIPCSGYASSEGLYRRSGIPPVGQYPVAFLEIEHPDYEPFRDSVMISHAVYLFRRGEDYCYQGSKMPVQWDERKSVVFVKPEQIPDVQKACEKSGGTFLGHQDVCGGEGKFSWSIGTEACYTSHPGVRQAREFRRKFEMSAVSLSKGDFAGGTGFTGMVWCNGIQGRTSIPEVLAFLEGWKKQGIIKNYSQLHGYESHPWFQFEFEEDEILRGGQHIDEFLRACGMMDVRQELYLWECPG